MAWTMATGGDGAPAPRALDDGVLRGIPDSVSDLSDTGGASGSAARKAIVDCVQGACGSTLSEALEVQARHSAEFMTSAACREGEIGAQYTKTMLV